VAARRADVTRMAGSATVLNPATPGGQGDALLADIGSIKTINAWLTPFKFVGMVFLFSGIALVLLAIVKVLRFQASDLWRLRKRRASEPTLTGHDGKEEPSERIRGLFAPTALFCEPRFGRHSISGPTDLPAQASCLLIQTRRTLRISACHRTHLPAFADAMLK
jgi:hypothetical protein